MTKIRKKLVLSLFIVIVLIISGDYLSRVSIPVLEPKGVIADQEFRLLIIITLIMLIVVVPVFFLLAFIVWRYRDDNNHRGKYTPDWDHSRLIEGIWWGIPTLLIIVVAIITWKATYALNPYKPIASQNPTITIQVVSMDWKWLFIYPKQHIATINYIEFPVNYPVHFYITSDAPMNSFWLPQLSGQIYAMAGMQTQLYLMANVKGTFIGRSANISGIGFAGMQFSAVAVNANTFKSWVRRTSDSPETLSLSEYKKLQKPSLYVPVRFFSRPVVGLFNAVINQYMTPESQAIKL